MKRIKLFIYEHAKEHIHDTIPEYNDCVPFSRAGIGLYCDIVNEPEQADLFYMGQFDDAYQFHDIKLENYQYAIKLPSQHIADIEGDWSNKEIPNWLLKCNLTINGLNHSLYAATSKYGNLFVRPTFSKLLVKLARGPKLKRPKLNYNRTFFFRGLPEPYGHRLRLKSLFEKSKVNGVYELTDKWNASISPTSSISTSYVEDMLKHDIALCPRGLGKDSVRFYEACAYGRVPVIFGDNVVFDNYEAPQIFTLENDENIIQKLQNISRLDVDVLETVAENSYNYFWEKVALYMKDPTGYYLKEKGFIS